MSILAQNHTDEVALLNCIQIFFVKHHVGKLLKQCNGTKDLTDASRKNVFIIDDSLFNHTSCKKTELGSKVFDHTAKCEAYLGYGKSQLLIINTI